jgi:putative hydrolase
VLDRLQAAMSVIEGHAEHVMDAAAASTEPGYARLRERLETRRARRGGLGEVVSRLLGMELKLRQYKLGKAFCDAVADERGIGGLNRVWSAPDALPTGEELERPSAWLERMGDSVVAAGA